MSRASLLHRCTSMDVEVPPAWGVGGVHSYFPPPNWIPGSDPPPLKKKKRKDDMQMHTINRWKQCKINFTLSHGNANKLFAGHVTVGFGGGGWRWGGAGRGLGCMLGSGHLGRVLGDPMGARSQGRWWARYPSKRIFRHFWLFLMFTQHLDTMYNPDIVLGCIPSH